VKNIKKKQKSMFDFSSSDIDKEQFSKLDEIGIREIHMCSKNSIVNGILNNISGNSFNMDKIFTSLDYTAIESASILLESVVPYIPIIYPLPYISTEKIKDKEAFRHFKKPFGKDMISLQHKKNTTNMHEYWKNKKINESLYNLKKLSYVIDWNEFYEKNPSSMTHNYGKFYDKLKSLCCEKYKNPLLHNQDIDTLVFVCDSTLLIDILKKCKHIKYNKKTDIIERSSVWEIDIDLNINSQHITFNMFDKIYPTEHNKNKLKYNNSSTYTYKDDNNNSFILFDSLGYMPLKYIKQLYLDRYSERTKKLIKNAIISVNKDKDKDTNNKHNNVPKSFRLENLK